MALLHMPVSVAVTYGVPFLENMPGKARPGFEPYLDQLIA